MTAKNVSFKIGFSSNCPVTYTKEEYVSEAETIIKQTADSVYAPVNAFMYIGFTRPEGYAALCINIYPNIPAWEDLLLLDKLDLASLLRLSFDVGTIENDMFHCIIAGLRAGLSARKK